MRLTDSEYRRLCRAIGILHATNPVLLGRFLAVDPDERKHPVREWAHHVFGIGLGAYDAYRACGSSQTMANAAWDVGEMALHCRTWGDVEWFRGQLPRTEYPVAPEPPY